MTELVEGRTGRAADGTPVIVRGGQIVSLAGPEFPGFKKMGGGIYEGDDGGTFQINRQGQLVRRQGSAGGNASDSRNARKDFEALQPVKDFRNVQSSFNSIQAAGADQTGASDMAMIFAFNKLMDPGSVVREGEFDRAAEIGGVPDRVISAIQKVQNGESLTPRLRQEIVNTAQSLYEVRRDQYNDLADRYRDIAKDDGLSPEAVARKEFRGQRVTSNPSTQEMGQANKAQDEARRGLPSYNPQAQIGTPQRPYILSPGVTIDQLPPASTYIDLDGKVRVQGREGELRFDADGSSYTTTGPKATSETPEELTAQGYEYDPRSDSYVRMKKPETMESVVEDRRTGNGFLRGADAVVRGIANGVTGGWSDEIVGGLNTVLPLDPGSRAFWQDGEDVGSAWRHNTDLNRAIDDSDVADVVALRRAGQAGGLVAGGIGSGAVAARVAPGLTRMAPKVANAGFKANMARQAGNAAKVAAIAAPQGAATAAGYTEGGILERGRNALGGAVAGALFGPVASKAINVVAPPVISAAQNALRPAAAWAAPALQAANLPGGNALSRFAARGADPLESGMGMLASKVGGANPNALSAEAQAFRDNAIEPVFFDVVGDGGQAVGRALATKQTPGRERAIEFAGQRRVGAQNRVSEIARRNISDDPRTAAQLADDLAAEQQALSAQAMGSPRAGPTQNGQPMGPLRDEIVRLTPETASVFRTEGGRKAIGQARSWTSNSQQSQELSDLARLSDDALDNPGQIDLTLGTVDRLRRSLTGQARSSGTDGDARQGLTSLSRMLRKDAAEALPEYNKFLTDYADRAQLGEAADFGRQFLGRQGSEEFAREASMMNPAQNRVARVSAREAIEDRGNTPSGAAGLLDDLSVGRGRSQRSDAFLGDDAERLRSNAEYARRELETGRNLSPRTGSPTNDNRMASAVADGVGLVRDVATGNKAGLAIKAANFLNKRGFSDDQAQAIIEAGLDPARTDEMIQMFVRSGLTRREARNTARAVRNLVVGSTTSSSGNQ